MRLLLLLFVVLFAKTESLSLGSFFNGLLGFSEDAPIAPAAPHTGALEGAFLNDTVAEGINNSTTQPVEYEYHDLESTGEPVEANLSTLATTTVLTETDAVTEGITTLETDSLSTLIPQTELGDFVDIDRDNAIDEGSGEEMPQGKRFDFVFWISRHFQIFGLIELDTSYKLFRFCTSKFKLKNHTLLFP